MESSQGSSSRCGMPQLPGPQQGLSAHMGHHHAAWLPRSMVAGFPGWGSPESELGEESQYKLMFYPWMPSREGVLEGDMWSLGMQLLVGFLSHRQEALGSIPSTDEPGLEGACL